MVQGSELELYIRLIVTVYSKNSKTVHPLPADFENSSHQRVCPICCHTLKNCAKVHILEFHITDYNLVLIRQTYYIIRF